MRFAITAAVLLLAAPVASSAQGTPDFSGTWVLQVDQTKFDSLAGPGPQNRTDLIEHKEPNLTIKRTILGPAGETVTNLTFVVDGRPHKNMAGSAEVTSVLKWEGATLVIESTSPDPQGGVFVITDRMSLSPDGRTLTQVRVLRAQGQEASQTFVLQKQ